MSHVTCHVQIMKRIEDQEVIRLVIDDSFVMSHILIGHDSYSLGGLYCIVYIGMGSAAYSLYLVEMKIDSPLRISLL